MTEKSKRGFASMTPEKRREIASLGGRSVPAEKRSFSQDHALASEAGRKGGHATAPAKRSYSRDTDLARASGRKGGLAMHRNARSHP